MAKLTNKQYKDARIDAENAPELFTFERFYSNGWSGYYSRYVSPESLKELRQEYKEIKAAGGFELKGFGNRAVIIPTEHGFVLQSYYTEVCEVLSNGEFVKLWSGYSNTTLKHINAFRHYFGMVALSKRDWIELETV